MVGPVFASEAGLTDPHLGVVPRTADEAARIAQVTRPTMDFTAPERFETHPAGAATVTARGDHTAFSLPSANLPFDDHLTFQLGDAMFGKLWVSSPSSTKASDGLGPLYNARSCQQCHVNDGRGHLPQTPGDNAISLVVQLSVPGTPTEAMAKVEGDTARAPDPIYGGQIQDFATRGHAAEARIAITYEDVPVTFDDGAVITLRKPSVALNDLAYGPLSPHAALSAKITPPTVGLGLLEAIPAADILALADPDDADGDGISGRPNVVWSVAHSRAMLGRFGRKATSPTIREQSAAAFASDIGLSTPLFPAHWGDCTGAQTACRAAFRGGDDSQGGLEVDDTGLDLVTFYVTNLAVPARRNPGAPEVLRGKQLFYGAGCAACHRPKFVTHRLHGDTPQSFQLIWPYTDMLLHDMGPGLADGRPEGRASGQEWRTAPLWGIGLTQQVSPEATFLHDGRARTLLEAVLWHGGEAEAARNAVLSLTKPDRDALVAFLESL